MNLKLEDVGAQRSFIFLWCGSCEGLDLGREVSAAVVHESHLRQLIFRWKSDCLGCVVLCCFAMLFV